jgi:beta-aspartyl-peptidase (threonine type)
MLEDDPHFNAGKGAVFNEKGQHELDASIMDGSTLACGAVAGVRTVKNPVSLARLVMTKTAHVLLMGDGAEEFATAMGVERVPNEWFDTAARRRAWERMRREQGGTAQVPRRPRDGHGTVGCVARDRQGRLAAATSTGGLTGKKWGRVGDTPVLGAGNWADGTAAVSGTGTGEEFIRHAVARTVAARMQFAGESLAAAVDAVVFHTLRKDDGGVIAVDRAGNLSAAYNSEGMYRGLADANGRFEVAVFED